MTAAGGRLTAKEVEGLAIIRRYVDRKGRVPTHTELARSLGSKHRTTGERVVSSLVRKGVLRRIKGWHHNTELVKRARLDGTYAPEPTEANSANEINQLTINQQAPSGRQTPAIGGVSGSHTSEQNRVDAAALFGGDAQPQIYLPAESSDDWGL